MKTNQLTQLSLQLSQLTHRLQQDAPSFSQLVRPLRLRTVSPTLKQNYRSLTRRLNRSKGWLLGGCGFLLLWILLWQWLLALGLGLMVTVGCYLVQQGQLKSWRGWQRLWSRANRALSLSALAGLVATGGSYLALAIWIESDRSWLASGLILQGLGLLAILSLLLWRQWRPESSSQANTHFNSYADSYLNQLSDTDPLQRLIAVRQLTQLVQRSNSLLPPIYLTPAHLSECFRLMLDREIEPLVCNALIEGLQQLNPTRQLETRQLESGSQPVQLSRTKLAQPRSQTKSD